MRLIKAKNLKKYKNEFQYISDDEWERVCKYVESHKFTKRDREKFHERLKDRANLKWNYLKMIFYIIPEPTPRPRLSLVHGRFYVRNSQSNSNFVKMVVEKEEDIFHIVKTPCTILVDSYFPIPKSFNKTDVLLAELGCIDMIKMPDFDNIVKGASDMIQKWVLENDSLIIDGRSRKFYSLKPRVEITIRYQT